MTLQSNPGNYYSVHGDLLFVVYDSVKANDPDTYTGYTYVADVYIGSELVARLKAAPRPDNKMGIFNVGNIIRNYIAASFNPTALQLRSQLLGSGDFYITATIKFGEEYGFTLYTNVLEDSARVYYNHYNGRLLGQNSSLADYVDRPLSVRPLTTPVDDDANFCFIPFLPSDTDNITLSIKTYNGSGLIGTNTQAFTPAANRQELFNVSPATINAAFPGFINSAVTYYTVEFQTPNAAPDVTYRFNLTCEAKFEVYTLHFLNRFGGFESRDFTKVSRKTIDIEKEGFGKLPYTIDASGAVSYKNSNNVYNETRSVYSSQYTEKMVLNTDILTDDEYTWLGDLVLSPMVYIEMDGYFVPVAVKAENYEFKKRVNEKMTNLVINVEFGETFNAQYR